MDILKIIYLHLTLCSIGHFGDFALTNTEDSHKVHFHEERLSSDNDIKQKQVILKKGDAVKLECEFPLSNQAWSYVQWIKLFEDGHQLKHIVIDGNQTLNNGSVVISSIVLMHVSGGDTANYSCILTSVSETSSMEFHVAVKEKAFCDEVLCKPRGRCIELLDGYECECEDGYTGDNCDFLDPCFDNPCLNNGSCLLTNNSFNCSCIEGFKGNTCEKETCMESSCYAGGSCSETDDGKIKCICNNNRAGKYCEHTCTFSSSKVQYGYRYCSYGKTCIIGARDGIERCRCTDYSHQSHCMMSSDVKNECSDPDICNGRGTCNDYTYGYSCSCQSYYSGKNCEFFNECQSSRNNVCGKYGGSCVNLVDGYKCTNCPTGQTGDKCQYMDNPCTVTCQQSYMVVRCDMRFLNKKLRQIQIHFNSKYCLFENDNRYYSFGRRSRDENAIVKKISYNECGTKITYEENEIVYRNSLRAGIFDDIEEENDVITRLTGNFKFDMECRMPIIFNNTSGMVIDNSMERNESVHLHSEGKVLLSTQVSFKNYAWNPISKYSVGDRLYVELQVQSKITNQILSRYGFLRPVTCYATSDWEGLGSQYVLLKEGCVKDSTFRFERRTGYQHQAHFSFKSFSFKGQRGKMYLHCNARFCVNITDNMNDFGFEECQNMCEDDKNKLDETTAVSSTMASMTENFTTSSNNNGGLLARMKRAIYGSEFYKNGEVIERDSGIIIHLNNDFDPFL